jgi:hypothetical protein
MNSRITFAALALSGLVLASIGRAQPEHPVEDTTPERGTHPAYGEVEREPLRPDPVWLRTEDFPGDLSGEGLQLSGTMLNTTVYQAEEEPMGEVVDLIVGLDDGRVAFIVVQPRTEFGEDNNVNLAISPRAVTVQHGYLVLMHTLEGVMGSQVVSEALLGELLADPEIAERLPAIVLVEQAPAPALFGQPGPRGQQQEPAPQGEAQQQQQPQQQAQQAPEGRPLEVLPQEALPREVLPREAQPRDARVAPEVRGGVPPEVRGGIPPEQETPVPVPGTGLDAGGPTGAEPTGR